MQSNVLGSAIESAENHRRFYCKFIAPNDIGLTNSHQEGIYVAKKAGRLFFNEEGIKGNNKEVWIKIHLQGDIPVESRAIWYGNKTRREYRITRFWAKTDYNKDEQLGNLLILIKLADREYDCYILDHEEEIETFLNHFKVSLTKNNAVIGLDMLDEKSKLENAIQAYAKQFSDEFPPSTEIALTARKFYRGNFGNLDNTLLNWVSTEYSIFGAIEQEIYKPYLSKPFSDLEELIKFANSALNRRKSRAGRSLEHHMNYILTKKNIPFDNPGRTEGNKKPDFLMPGTEAYHNLLFDEEKLVFLGAKTTCKDRWRQILNEADRIPVKHLLTLQQGISKNQLEEMKKANVKLVVPKAYHKMYPPIYQNELLDVSTFIAQMVELYQTG